MSFSSKCISIKKAELLFAIPFCPENWTVVLIVLSTLIVLRKCYITQWSTLIKVREFCYNEICYNESWVYLVKKKGFFETSFAQILDRFVISTTLLCWWALEQFLMHYFPVLCTAMWDNWFLFCMLKSMNYIIRYGFAILLVNFIQKRCKNF